MHDEKYHKPPMVSSAARMPQGKSGPKKTPQHKEKKEWLVRMNPHCQSRAGPVAYLEACHALILPAIKTFYKRISF